MKKILASVAAISAIVLVATGATYAVFSAQGNINGNTISSASVNLVVHNFSGNKPINTSNLVPGEWTPDGRAELYNTGTVPVKVYMYVENLAGDACPKTNLLVSTGFAGGNETLNELYNGPLTDIVGAANRFETTVNPPFDVMGPNISQAIHQQAQLDPTADNGYMGESCTWDEVFVAESVAPAI